MARLKLYGEWVQTRSFLLKPYPFRLHIAVVDHIPWASKETLAHCSTWPGGACIALRRGDLRPKLIAHECFHAFEALEDYIGDRIRGEAGAYLLQSIFEKCEETIKKDAF